VRIDGGARRAAVEAASPDPQLTLRSTPTRPSARATRAARPTRPSARRPTPSTPKRRWEEGREGGARRGGGGARACTHPDHPTPPTRQAQDEKRRARDAEREAREEAEAEAAQKKADDEAAAWMAQIQTEETGETAVATEEESQGLLQEFIDYIVTRKTVGLEDLASAFGLRVVDAIQRVQALEAEGRLTGVMDDRGKFIHVSMDEMKVGRGGGGGGGVDAAEAVAGHPRPSSPGRRRLHHVPRPGRHRGAGGQVGRFHRPGPERGRRARDARGRRRGALPGRARGG